MKHILVYTFIIMTLNSCGQAQNNVATYPEHVGDIAFDASFDDPNFKVCNKEIFQYYNFGKGLQYKGEKIAIDKYFGENFKNARQEDETGFLTIRFIVNCEGGTGRFRVEGMDNNYQIKKFKNDLTDQILKLTKQMDGWIAGNFEGRKMDYYQYLTFKLEVGQIIEIMP